MNLYHTELVCAAGCGYEVSISNAARSAFRRSTPDECRMCGADLETPKEKVEVPA